MAKRTQKSTVATRRLEDLLHSLSLSDKMNQAIAWCKTEGAASIEDLTDETYAQELAAALQLPPIRANKLVKALKNS